MRKFIKKMKQHVTFRDLLLSFFGLIIVFILLTPIIFATNYFCKEYFDFNVLE